MMIKIKIYTVGKTKEAWLGAALDEYQKRLSHEISINWNIVKVLHVIKEKSYICLDSKGKQYTSLELAGFFEKEAVKEDAKLIFVIGGPEGVPESILLKATHLISFSKQTFTHQMTRLILLEQLYRWIQIQKGRSYHK